jgi:hypothetical protein
LSGQWECSWALVKRNIDFLWDIQLVTQVV